MYSKSLAKSKGNNDFLSIRYEDISLDPMAAAEKIYDFVNEELPRLEFNFIMTQYYPSISCFSNGSVPIPNSVPR